MKITANQRDGESRGQSETESSKVLMNRDARISQAVGEFFAAVEAGNADRSALLAKYQDIADELADCLATFDFVNNVAPQLAPAADAERPSSSPAQLATLGDFRIIRELGRGGMGVVYEAEQISLGRRVALKVLPLASTLSPQQLKRFKNEARAAAALRHPNIVGVYSVGAERGIHYYAMELVEGRSLAQLIAVLHPSAEVRPALEATSQKPKRGIVEQALNLDEMSVSRRSAIASQAESDSFSDADPIDTQPIAALSTVRTRRRKEYYDEVARMIADAADALEYAHSEAIVHRDVKPANLLVDDRQHIWVADFGLARLENEVGITMSGDLLGTLRYMSPEQAQGRPATVDHRSDVYSLGVTLYELLTGRPAFMASNRQQLLREITERDPPPLRTLDPSVPYDLETIVSKAIAKDPIGRYQTSGEFADDLRRFRANQPIVARRPTMGDHLLRWTRRHARAVIAASLVLFVAVVGLSVGTLLLATARDTAEQHRKESESNLSLAADAIDDLLVGLAQQARKHGNLAESEQFLNKAIDFYERLASRSNDPIVVIRAARAYNVASGIQSLLGRHEAAKKLNEAAIGMLERLAPAAQEQDEALAERARAYSGIASFHGRDLRPDRMEQPNTMALELCERLAERHPENPRYKQSLIEELDTRAMIYINTDRLEEAKLTYARLIELQDQLPETILDTANAQNRLAGTGCNFGTLLVELGELERAAGQFRKSVARQESILAAHAEEPKYLNDWMVFQWNLADVLVRQRDHVAASQAAMALVERFPDRLQAFYEAAEILTRCATASDSDEVAQRFREDARDLIKASAGATERTPDALQYFAWFLAMSPDETIRDPQRALELSDAAIVQIPDRRFPHEVRGIALYRLGKFQDAIQAIETSVSFNSGEYDIVDILFLAMAEWQTGNQDVARERYQSALQWFANYQQEQPSVYDFLTTAHQQILAEASGLIADHPDE